MRKQYYRSIKIDLGAAYLYTHAMSLWHTLWHCLWPGVTDRWLQRQTNGLMKRANKDLVLALTVLFLIIWLTGVNISPGLIMHTAPWLALLLVFGFLRPCINSSVSFPGIRTSSRGHTNKERSWGKDLYQHLLYYHALTDCDIAISLNENKTSESLGGTWKPIWLWFDNKSWALESPCRWKTENIWCHSHQIKQHFGVLWQEAGG